MDALNAEPTELTLGAISYGMDFLDQANLLGIWVSSGRHAWENETYDNLVAEASTVVGDDDLRNDLFAQAEEVLVSDVGGVFIAHRWQGICSSRMYKVRSAIPIQRGNGVHWGNSWVYSDLYIAE